MVQVSIKHLLGADTGALSEDAVHIPHPEELFVIPDDGVLGAESPIDATAILRKTEDGFEVCLEDLQGDLSIQCFTCMKPYTYSLSIPVTSIVFFAMPKSHNEDSEDFIVDVVKARLPLDELLRQEIIMALPTHQKCARPKCIVPETPKPRDDTIRPFEGLKDFLA